MTTVRHGAKMTLQEYRDLGPVDEGVWELAEGVLFEMAPPNWEHQSLVDFLVMMINTFLAASDPLPGWSCSGTGVVLSETTAPTPDMVYVRAERGHLIQGSFVEGVPDVVVEVMSQDRRRDLVMKRGWYAAAGAPEYWIIDPVSDTILVLELAGSEYVERAELSRSDTLSTPTIPRFELELERLFGNPGRTLPSARR
jgi:Uma2 family endonuclease